MSKSSTSGLYFEHGKVLTVGRSPSRLILGAATKLNSNYWTCHKSCPLDPSKAK